MQLKGQSNIRCNSPRCEQVQLLKHNAHPAPLPAQIGAAQAGPVAAGNPDLASVWSLKTRDAAQERGLSGAAQA